MNSNQPRFLPAVSHSSGAYWAWAAKVGDLDGDGKLDLVVANDYGDPNHCYRNGAVSVLLGNGDGTFQHVVTHRLGGAGTTSIAVADVNGDGKADLLVIHNDRARWVYCWAMVRELSTRKSSTTLVVNGPHAVRAADVDRNGSPDLLIANGTGCCPINAGTVSVLINSTSLTSTALASSSNPSVYGQKVSWTATVISSGSITPTGKARFTWGGYTSGRQHSTAAAWLL